MSTKQQLSRLSPLTVGSVLLFAGIMTYVLVRVFAASGPANLYTSPAGTQSVTNGQSFAVNVRISTPADTPTVCAEVFMSYPAGNLQVLGESYGGPYSFEATPATNSGGTLHMVRCAAPGSTVPGGDQLYAQVTFKAVATGSASIGFTGSSVVTSADTNANILSQRNGVTYNISAPATPPPSSGGGSTGSGGGSTSSSGGTSSSGSTHSSGSSGGSSAAGGSSSGSTGSSGGGSSSSGDSGSTGSTGSGSTSDNGTPGEASTTAIAITVLDADNKPVVGAEVVINGQTVKTDKTGIAYFTGVPSGNQDVTIKYNGKKTSKTLEIKDASSVQSPQTFKVSITRNKFNPVLLLIPFIILAGAGVFFVRPWDKHLTPAFGQGQDETLPVVVSSSDNPAPTPTVQPATPAGHKLEQPGTVYTPTPQADEKQPPKE